MWIGAEPDPRAPASVEGCTNPRPQIFLIAARSDPLVLRADLTVANAAVGAALARAKVFGAEASAVLAIDDITTIVVLRNAKSGL